MCIYECGYINIPILYNYVYSYAIMFIIVSLWFDFFNSANVFYIFINYLYILKQVDK